MPQSALQRKGTVERTMPFSVIMSVYKNDNPEHLNDALASVVNQTLQPSEIVIVGDGPVSDACLEVIDRQTAIAAQDGIDIIFLPQDQNRGLGESLRIAVENSRYDYVARMDSDDLSLPLRFEQEMRCFEEDSDLALVGGMITEFVDKPDQIIDKRILPLEDAEIKRFMRSRCGVNHVTVIMKKSELIRAGNYNNDYRQEDYYLWARMIKAGCKFRNVPEVVVNVRSGRGQFARRSGLSYYQDHMAIFRFMYREGLISLPRLIYNGVVRGLVQGLFPNWLRTLVYQKLLRSKNV